MLLGIVSPERVQMLPSASGDGWLNQHALNFHPSSVESQGEGK